MNVQEQVREDMVVAMKAKDETRLSVLRGIISAFTSELTATKRTPQDKLSDEEALAVIRKAVKQRQDSAEQFRKGGREELAAQEEKEKDVLNAYLPQLMSKADVEKVVKKKIEAMGVADKASMGKLMGAVMVELKGKADGKDVKDAVEAQLL